MYDDCECSSDNSLVLPFARKNEAGLLALFTRGVEQGREAIEFGLEQELQVMSASFVLLSTYAEVDAVGVSAAGNAHLPRLADSDTQCLHDS
jgi:hypothetical protein